MQLILIPKYEMKLNLMQIGFLIVKK